MSCAVRHSKGFRHPGSARIARAATGVVHRPMTGGGGAAGRPGMVNLAGSAGQDERESGDQGLVAAWVARAFAALATHN
jgi:hypothetical protein